MNNLQATKQAQENGYLVTPNSGRFSNAQNAYWFYCVSRKMPYLKFALRRKYARLYLDTEPSGRFIDPEGQAKMHELAQRLGVKSYMCGSSGLILYRVPIEEIDQVARELLTICKNFSTDEREVYDERLD